MTPLELAAQQKEQEKATARSGFFFAFFAYFIWGFLPLYLKAVDHIPAIEVVAHRAFWSLPVAGILLIYLRRTKDILVTLKSPKKLGILFFSAAIISVNWGIYVWAIAVERTIEAALGYYINPLMSVALGALFLGERFTRAQLVALTLATMAVVLLSVQTGVFPWVGLSLAVTFAMYGFIRKTIDVGPTQGFLIEVLLLSLVALPFITWLQLSGEGHLFTNTSNTLLLLGCGPITAIPLILYAFGAKRLRLSTLGLMQYIAPTLIFSMGLFVFGEPFDKWQLAAFVLIWIALAIFSSSAIKQQNAK
ncbi:MAG: EamA family transporter RarD [Nitratireductor sp.]